MEFKIGDKVYYNKDGSYVREIIDIKLGSEDGDDYELNGNEWYSKDELVLIKNSVEGFDNPSMEEAVEKHKFEYNGQIYEEVKSISGEGCKGCHFEYERDEYCEEELPVNLKCGVKNVIYKMVKEDKTEMLKEYSDNNDNLLDLTSLSIENDKLKKEKKEADNKIIELQKLLAEKNEDISILQTTTSEQLKNLIKKNGEIEELENYIKEEREERTHTDGYNFKLQKKVQKLKKKLKKANDALVKAVLTK